MLTLLYSTLHHISHTTAFLAVTTSSSSLVAVRRRRSNLTTQTEDGELGFVEDSEELLATVDLPMTENEIATRPYKSRLNYKTLSVFMIICVLCIVTFIVSTQSKEKQQLLEQQRHFIPSLSCPPTEPAQLLGYYGSNTVGTILRSTGSNMSIAQGLFEEGLRQLYGYNLLEAQRNMQAAVSSDPTCATCYWGLAMSFGININTSPRYDMYIQAKLAINKAYELMLLEDNINRLTDIDIGLIRATKLRYAAVSEYEWTEKGQQYFDEIYAKEMYTLAHLYSSDIDAVVLWIDAAINLTPWDYFLPLGDIKPQLSEAYRMLRSLVELPTPHLLALHLWIHITEQSPQPKQGEAAADLLSHLLMTSNETSHLVHMSAHTYFRIGRYRDCLTVSERAITIDQLYISKCLIPYLPSHNKALYTACATYSGNLQDALLYSPDIFNADEKSSIWLSGIFPINKELVYTRFGYWDLVLSQSSRVSTAADLSPFLSAVALYSQTLAILWKFGKNESIQSFSGFQESSGRIPQDNLPKSHIFYPYHKEVVQLLNYTLLSAYAVYDKKHTIAIKYLDQAVLLQDSFHYMEPEHHYMPMRQCLGAVLKEECLRLSTPASSLSLSEECRRYVEVYNQDLKQHPKNIWSLLGLGIVERQLGADLKGSCCELNLCS